MVFSRQLSFTHHGHVVVVSDGTIFRKELGEVSEGTRGSFNAVLGDGTGDGGHWVGERRKRGMKDDDDPIGEEAKRTKRDWSTADPRCVVYARIVVRE